MFYRIVTSQGIKETEAEKRSAYRLVLNGEGIQEDEEDVTNIDDLMLLYLATCMDYKQFRSSVAAYIESIGGFSQLSSEHKLSAATHFAVAKSSRDAVLTINAQVEAGVGFHSQSISCRTKRVARVEAEIYNRIDPAHHAAILAPVAASNLVYLYTRFGLEGTLSGDGPGLYDYLNSTADKPWASSGLRAQSFEVDGLEDCSELADRCLSILRGEL